MNRHSTLETPMKVGQVWRNNLDNSVRLVIHIDDRLIYFADGTSTTFSKSHYTNVWQLIK